MGTVSANDTPRSGGSSGSGSAASVRQLLPLLPTDSLTLWTEQTQTGSGATFQIDSSVLLAGNPTIRIDIPANYAAGAGGSLSIGTSGATLDIPYGWDRDDLAVGFQLSNLQITGPTVYIGDATYSSFWTASANVGVLKQRVGEFIFPKYRNGVLSGDDFGVGAGTPATWLSAQVGGATAPKMRAKLRFAIPAGNANASVWVGFFGKLPKRKPKLILMFDDGNATVGSLLAPMCRHFGIPVSLPLGSSLINTGGMMTTAQVLALHNDQSRLFSVMNHSTDNTSYLTLGAAAYYANIVACRDWLRSIGVTHDGPLHHAYVQTEWGNDLIDLMSAGGFLTGRGGAAGTAYALEHKDQAIPFGDKQRWRVPVISFLDNTVTLATAKTSIDDLITRGGFGALCGHILAASAGASTWATSDMAQLMGYIRAKVDAGLLDVTTWPEWYRDLVGP